MNMCSLTEDWNDETLTSRLSECKKGLSLVSCKMMLGLKCNWLGARTEISQRRGNSHQRAKNERTRAKPRRYAWSKANSVEWDYDIASFAFLGVDYLFRGKRQESYL